MCKLVFSIFMVTSLCCAIGVYADIPLPSDAPAPEYIIDFETPAIDHAAPLNGLSYRTTDPGNVISGAGSLYVDTVNNAFGSRWKSFLDMEDLPEGAYTVEFDYKPISETTFLQIMEKKSSATTVLLNKYVFHGLPGHAVGVFKETKGHSLDPWFYTNGKGITILDNITFRKWPSLADASDAMRAMRINPNDIAARLLAAKKDFNGIEKKLPSLPPAINQKLTRFISFHTISSDITALEDSMTNDSDTVANRLLWKQRLKKIERNVFKLKAFRDTVVEENSATMDFLTFSHHSTRKIRRDAPYNYDVNTHDQIHISAAGNEHESFQVLVVPLWADINDLTVEFTDLTGPSGYTIAKTNLVWYSVEYTETTKDLYPVEYIGYWPDPLRKSDYLTNHQTTVPMNWCLRPLWITLYVPKSACPGDYTGTVRIKSASGQSRDMTLHVKVRNFALPFRPYFKTAFRNPVNMETLTAHRMGRANSGNDNVIIERPNGSIYLNKAHINKQFNANLPLGLGTQAIRSKYWGYNATNYKLTVIPEGSTKPETRTFPMYGTEHLGYVSQFHKEWWDYIKQRNLEDVCFSYVMDEPAPSNYSNMNLLLNTIATVDPSIRTVVPGVPRPGDSLSDFKNLKIMCPGLSSYDPHLAAQGKAAGKESWWYVCFGPKKPYPNLFIDYPSIDHRIIMWMSWKYGVEGFLYWQMQNWVRNPWKDPETYASAHGDGCLYYPPLVNGEIVITIRLENFRDGIDDYDYLAILKKYLDIASNTKKFSDAELLRRARNLLVIGTEIVTDRTHYTEDANIILKRREQIAQAIDDLKEALDKK